jgi:hypothetical protein
MGSESTDSVPLSRVSRRWPGAGTPTSIDGDGLKTMLPEAAHAPWDVEERSLIRAWHGARVLPDEAADPIEALMLADERLLARRENRASRERRKNPVRDRP